MADSFSVCESAMLWRAQRGQPSAYAVKLRPGWSEIFCFSLVLFEVWNLCCPKIRGFSGPGSPFGPKIDWRWCVNSCTEQLGIKNWKVKQSLQIYKSKSEIVYFFRIVDCFRSIFSETWQLRSKSEFLFDSYFSAFSQLKHFGIIKTRENEKIGFTTTDT